MTNDKKPIDIEDPCKDYKNCKNCAHYDGPLCQRNFGAEAVKGPIFWLWLLAIILLIITILENNGGI